MDSIKKEKVIIKDQLQRSYLLKCNIPANYYKQFKEKTGELYNTFVNNKEYFFNHHIGFHLQDHQDFLDYIQIIITIALNLEKLEQSFIFLNLKDCLESEDFKFIKKNNDFYKPNILCVDSLFELELDKTEYYKFSFNLFDYIVNMDSKTKRVLYFSFVNNDKNIFNCLYGTSKISLTNNLYIISKDKFCKYEEFFNV